MPLYVFRHPEYPVTIEVLQSMKEPHVYFDDEGVEWVRVWEAPNTIIDSDINPDSAQEWEKKTQNKKMTLGDAWDKSKELSEKRVKKYGYDPMKQKRFDEYRTACKKRGGTEKNHPFEQNAYIPKKDRSKQ